MNRRDTMSPLTLAFVSELCDDTSTAYRIVNLFSSTVPQDSIFALDVAFQNISISKRKNNTRNMKASK